MLECRRGGGGGGGEVRWTNQRQETSTGWLVRVSLAVEAISQCQWVHAKNVTTQMKHQLHMSTGQWQLGIPAMRYESLSFRGMRVPEVRAAWFEAQMLRNANADTLAKNTISTDCPEVSSPGHWPCTSLSTKQRTTNSSVPAIQQHRHRPTCLIYPLVPRQLPNSLQMQYEPSLSLLAVC